MTFEELTREFARMEKFTEEYNRLQKEIKNSIKDSLESSRKMEFSGVSGIISPSSMADLVSVERRDYAGEVSLLFLVKTRYTNEFNHWLSTSHPKPKLIESGSGDFADMYLVAIYHSSDIGENLSYLNPELATMISHCDRVNVSKAYRNDRIPESDRMDVPSLTGMSSSAMCFAPWPMGHTNPNRIYTSPAVTAYEIEQSRTKPYTHLSSTMPPPMTPAMSGKKLNGGVETITENPSQRRSFWELLKESIGFKKKMKKPESNDIKEYRPE
jgi:hypothetical protein